MRDIVVLDGGLGNNLFQLHYAWNLRRSSVSDRVDLYAPKSKGSVETQFLETAARNLGLKFTIGSEAPGSAGILIARSKRMLSEKKIFARQREVFAVTTLPSCRVHCGYWQTIPFTPATSNPFDDALSELLPDGSINKPILHVRGGDYRSRKNAKIYAELDQDYYHQAFAEIESRMTPSEYHLVSNDPSHVETLFGNETRHFQPRVGGSALDDFTDISRHKVIVASNSTFCWWAARLGLYKRQTDLVIAPRHWLNEGYRHRSHPRYSGPANQVVLKA